ncbi:hypothetical protein GOV11_01610 [Candidatus Woesearchaeota archaeon]|nr:hypothetical protein [Candidatus Woesearchaeota archaeon]
MIPLISSVIILYIGLFIGFRAAKDVQDEIIPSRQYLLIAMDALLVISAGIVLWNVNTLAVIIGVVALIAVRQIWGMQKIFAPISGFILAGAFFVSSEVFITVSVVLLVMNYIKGAESKKISNFAIKGISQPIAAIIFGIALNSI